MYLTDKRASRPPVVTLVEGRKDNGANLIFFAADLLGVSSPMLDLISLSEQLSEKYGFNLNFVGVALKSARQIVLNPNNIMESDLAQPSFS
ncbi:hypothetical protein TNIN_336651 [Trichonephila inaurata madagascariensis]|uniref:Uncharacterized protein n=1 Tax=Trichonephila inaurata madagascariensis TaxID=2747483 RepID=A0A8X6XXJ6_9ARAC|nr:hypothetical protein TNIN_272891 [Trichonephila inaurata madagascariensis]GFY60524.1 hypothetical protein TNIN_336651 [Trichonephila inaurata madagascariensis]